MSYALLCVDESILRVIIFHFLELEFANKMIYKKKTNINPALSSSDVLTQRAMTDFYTN